MIKFKALKYLAVSVLSMLFAFITFTSIFLNLFQRASENMLASIVGVKNLSYHRIHGNLIKGFSVDNLFIYDDGYTFRSVKSEFEIYLSDFFDGFSNIDLATFKDSHLILNSSIQSQTKEDVVSSLPIDRISFDKINIYLDNNKLFFNALNIARSLEKGYTLKGSARANLFQIPSFNVKDIEINIIPGNKNTYSFLLESLDFDEVALTNIYLSGKAASLNDLEGTFNISESSVLSEDFYELSGNFNYLNNIYSLKLDTIYENNLKPFIGGYLEIQDNVIDVQKIIVQIQNESPMSMQNQKMLIQKGSLTGENIAIKYRDGELSLESFSIKDFSNYYFDMEFNSFDIRLFRGLGAEGYLSGKLYISSKDSAFFSNAKIENFSYEGFDFDSVNAEGTFQDNQLDISNLKVSKQIGFLDVSGSFSSIDNLYNSIIDKIKLKLKF
tara:strand:+ start:1501 stop:2823 length:1323 start_codon:yes stop_codon:yes gene_type:complete